MTEKLLAQFKTQISTFELVPSGGGCFEIDLDGKRIYSKNNTGEFPDESTILKLVKKKS